MSDKIYKRKARPKIYVQAFIFGYDETPEWFTNCKGVCIPQRLIYEDGKTISFTPGNYICRNLDGNLWVEEKEGFLNRYLLIGE